MWSGAELVINGAVATNGKNKLILVKELLGLQLFFLELVSLSFAASVIAVLKKEKAISLGNLIGSNMFNVLAVIGITALIKPISIIDDGIITSDIF